jgi:pSer/pThr/pTyr-binding forkhead associated (FHA) protein
VLKVISAEMPVPLREQRPEIPRRLEQICMKCLGKQPADRYPSALALAEELRRYRASPMAPAPESTAARKVLPSVVLVELTTGKRFRLRGETVVIGRAAECQFVVKAADVSKRHCRLHLRAGGAEVEDLHSANGTFVNGQQVERCELHDGDRLDIAEHSFEVHLPGPHR